MKDINLTEIRLSRIPCGNVFYYNDKEYKKYSRYRANYIDQNKQQHYRNFKKHCIVLINTSTIKWGK
jgi:hypothetical protein